MRRPVAARALQARPVRIGDRAQVGIGAIVLKGVRLGAGAGVGAGAATATSASATPRSSRTRW